MKFTRIFVKDYQFPGLKAQILCFNKEIERLRGDAHPYVAQASLPVDEAKTKKMVFRSKVKYLDFAHKGR